MITIEALLQRIHWDPDFGRGSFTIGYYDRLRRALVTVPLEQIRPTPGNHFSFAAVEPDGAVHEVPYHRVREPSSHARTTMSLLERVWRGDACGRGQRPGRSPAIEPLTAAGRIQDVAECRARQPPYSAISPGIRISAQMIFDRFACTQEMLPNR